MKRGFETHLDFYASLPIFEGFAIDEINTISQLFNCRLFKKGDVIFSDTDTGKNFYIVINGALVLSIKDLVIKTFVRGDSFGEVALIDESSRTGSVIAQEDSELCCVDGNILFDPSIVNPELALKLFRNLSRKVTHYLRSVEDIKSKQLQELVKQRTAELQKYTALLENEIQERKKTEIALQEAKETAEEASNAKSEFLANMSHELRTPLNGILGFTQILKMRYHSEENLNEQLSIIEQSGEHLLTLINDVLDLAKIEAQRMELELETVDLMLILKSVANMISIKAQQKSIGFEFIPEKEMNLTAVVDQRKLRQILLNLLGNAVKFTEQGKVTLSVSYHRMQDNLIELRITVSDTGSGIPKEKIDEIFQAFTQLSGTRKAEGTGLGLAITKQLIELMDGEITVDSVYGEGSCFTVKIPLRITNDNDKQTEIASERIIGYEGNAKEIMIVDDNKVNLSLLENYLSDIGFSVIQAKNGEEAIELLQLKMPDIILLDIFMPKIDGLHVAKYIRSSEHTSQCTIIAMSANVFERNKKQCIEAGCDDFIGKPIVFRELTDSIGKHLNLKWEYASEKELSNQDNELIFPDDNVIMKLHESALLGDISSLEETLIDLQKEETYKIFSGIILKYLRIFDVDSIKKFLQPYVQK